MWSYWKPRLGIAGPYPLQKNTPGASAAPQRPQGPPTAGRICAARKATRPGEPRPVLPDAGQPDTWKDCRQREPGRAGSAGTPRRNPAQLAGHQDRHPVPPQRRTGPAPHPFRLQPLKDCRPTPPGRLDLSAAVEAGPDAASTPAATRPPAPRPPGELCRTRAQDADGSPAHRHGPGRQLDTSTRGALPPAESAQLDTMDTQAPAPPRPRLREICRDGRGRRRHGPACPAGHLNARADPAAIVSAAASQRHPWTRGAGGPPDTSTPAAGGARKKHQTRRNSA